MTQDRRLPFVLLLAGAAALATACGSKKEAAPAAGSGSASAAASAAPAAPAAPVVDAAPAQTGRDLECVSGAHYKLALKWKGDSTCSLGPETTKQLAFTTSHFPEKLSDLEVLLDDGVMQPSSSPYYEQAMTLEQVAGCKLTVKLEQPPSHQTWAFLTLELTVDGKKVTGTGAYTQTEEGESCETSATVTGSFEEVDISG